jgi:Protein of unknown function (DUF4236)
MGFRFRRSVKILPGIRLNFGKRGVSTSIGVRGAHVTVGRAGTRTTVGLPGSGLSYTHLEKPHQAHQAHQEASSEAQAATVLEVLPKGRAWRGWVWIAVLVAIVAAFIINAIGCATTVAPGAETVRVATAAQKEKLCESIKVISVEQRLGPNKPGNAMTKALNAVAAAGGNGIYIISTSTDWADGASVTAEALRCRW